jgi:D-psicose/D-tagatose/L-ribulose 3-epimerase
MRIGINTFLFVWPFTTKSTRLLRKVKDWGFDTVEIAFGSPGDFDAGIVRRELDKLGLACGSLCGVFGEDRDLRGTAAQQRNSMKYLRAAVDCAATVGAKTVAGPVYSAVGRAEAVSPADRRAQWKTVVKNLREIAPAAEDKGVQICIEPLNRFETDFVNTAEQAVQMAEDVDRPSIKVMLDTFHMNIEEKNPAAAIKRTGKLLGHVHACGCDRGTPGNDHIDWKSIAAALKAIRYDGDLVIESFTTQVEMIARAASIWRKFEPSQEDIAIKGLKFLRTL